MREVVKLGAWQKRRRALGLHLARVCGAMSTDTDKSVLGAFLRRERDEIVARWLARLRGQSVASDLDQQRLKDDAPELLEWIAKLADEAHAGHYPSERSSIAHAQSRLESG